MAHEISSHLFHTGKRGREVPGSRYIRHTSHKDLAEKSQKLFSDPGVYES